MMTSSYTVSISACVGAHTQVEVECVVVRPYNDTSLMQLLYSVHFCSTTTKLLI